jgi:hypothetical protein
MLEAVHVTPLFSSADIQVIRNDTHPNSATAYLVSIIEWHKRHYTLLKI